MQQSPSVNMSLVRRSQPGADVVAILVKVFGAIGTQEAFLVPKELFAWVLRYHKTEQPEIELELAWKRVKTASNPMGLIHQPHHPGCEDFARVLSQQLKLMYPEEETLDPAACNTWYCFPGYGSWHRKSVHKTVNDQNEADDQSRLKAGLPAEHPEPVPYKRMQIPDGTNHTAPQLRMLQLIDDIAAVDSEHEVLKYTQHMMSRAFQQKRHTLLSHEDLHKETYQQITRDCDELNTMKSPQERERQALLLGIEASISKQDSLKESMRKLQESSSNQAFLERSEGNEEGWFERYQRLLPAMTALRGEVMVSLAQVFEVIGVPEELVVPKELFGWSYRCKPDFKVDEETEVVDGAWGEFVQTYAATQPDQEKMKALGCDDFNNVLSTQLRKLRPDETVSILGVCRMWYWVPGYPSIHLQTLNSMSQQPGASINHLKRARIPECDVDENDRRSLPLRVPELFPPPTSQPSSSQQQQLDKLTYDIARLEFEQSQSRLRISQISVDVASCMHVLKEAQRSSVKEFQLKLEEFWQLDLHHEHTWTKTMRDCKILEQKRSVYVEYGKVLKGGDQCNIDTNLFD